MFERHGGSVQNKNFGELTEKNYNGYGSAASIKNSTSTSSYTALENGLVCIQVTSGYYCYVSIDGTIFGTSGQGISGDIIAVYIPAFKGNEIFVQNTNGLDHVYVTFIPFRR